MWVRLHLRTARRLNRTLILERRLADITIIIQATITLMAGLLSIIPLIRTKTTATQQQQLQNR